MYRLTLLFSLLISVNLLAQSWSEEEKAIIDALNEEGAAVVAMDMKRLAALHVQDDLAVRYNLGGDKVLTGWNEIKENFEKMFEQVKNSAWENANNSKKNIVIKVTGKTAWVLCDNVWNWEENGEKKERINKEIAFLEKDNGKWKLSFYTFLRKSE